VNVAGKPVLGHILDGMANLQFEEIIFVVGYLGAQIQEYISTSHPAMRARYVEQKQARGQAQAIWLAREHIDQEVLIIFGDTIWETDWSRLDRVKSDGLIFVKEVSDPRRFGVVTVENGFATRFVEKPEQPVSNLAVIGVYYIRNWRALLDSIDEIMTRGIQTKGEYYLADAFQNMIEHGAKFQVETIEVWKDCGTREALLDTNQYLLSKNAVSMGHTDSSQIIPPVYIDKDAQVTRSIVGPFVSISSGAVIEDSILRNSIVSEDAQIQNASLEASLIGSNARVRGTFDRLNVGDSSEIDFSK
jgi:glucose-1-phosphate thymidylyltransferase